MACGLLNIRSMKQLLALFTIVSTVSCSRSSTPPASIPHPKEFMISENLITGESIITDENSVPVQEPIQQKEAAQILTPQKKKIAVIMVYFRDRALGNPPNLSKQTIAQTLFSETQPSVRSYYLENSYGKI